MISKSIVTKTHRDITVWQTKGHTTMLWSANVEITSKTAFTASGTQCPPCRERRLVKLSLPVLQAHDVQAPMRLGLKS